MSSIVRRPALAAGGPFRRHDAATRAQTEAADPRASAWVSANAGSGKTRVLTNRVARLLLSGAEPQRILCLTYTKAAAAEMQNRLFKTLGGWAMAADGALAAAVDRLLTEDEPPLAAGEREAARRLFARALETPGGLKIQTIHAFCESLLSRFPLEAGVSPHFTVVDEGAAEELLTEAQNQVALARAADPALAAAFDRLLSAAAEATAQDLFGEILSNRAGFARGGAAAEAALAKALGALDLSGVDAILARWRAGLDPAALGRLASAFEDGAASEAKRAGPLRAALAAGSDRAAFDAAAAAVLTQKFAPPLRGFPSKTLEKAHPWALEPIAALQAGLMATQERLAAAERLEASAALARIARALLDAYAALKAERAGLDYDDLIERAVGLLTRSDARDWVRFKLDGGVEHILVDEAQDTSPTQWRVIGALAEEFFAGAGAREARDQNREDAKPRTVFAVGDEKQSIYSFQGAAPALLAETGARFGARAAAAGLSFRASALDTSFRSTPAILGFVDRVFQPAEARAGLLFGGREAVSHVAHRAAQPGAVELWPLVEPRPADEPPAWDEPVDAAPPDDPQRRLAGLVAEQIAAWIGREPLPARGRAMRAGDVLVLVRKRGPLSVGVIKRLKQLGVPVSGEDRLVLTGQLAVKDLLALGRFCLCPEDDLTLAALLRSPFCDVDEDGLFELAHGRDGDRRLWYALKEWVRLRPDDRPEFGRAERLLQSLIDKADFLRPFELFAHALSADFGAGSGRARLVGRLGAEAEDPIDEFLAQALGFESEGAPTLQAFVGRMTARAAEIKREHEQGRDEVRVMTAHGAKGLEAPVVILPDTTGPPTGGRAPKLLDPGPDSGAPPIWIGRKETDPPRVSMLRQAREDREAEEHRRLLYVALTRAEDRLLICGALGARKLPEGSWYGLCRAAMEGAAEARRAPSPVRDASDVAAPGWRIDGAGDAVARHDDPPGAAALPPPPAPWIDVAPRKEPLPQDLSPSKLGGEDPEREAEILVRGSGLEAGAAADRGTLIHLLLETLAELPDEAARRVRGDAILRREGAAFDGAARAGMLEEALRVFAMPEAGALFGPGSRAEVPVGAVLPALGPGELHGIVDRLVIGPDRVSIVDFKTGAIPAEPPEAYRRQLAAYRAAVRPLYPDRPIEAALLWTAAPRLEHVSESALDAAFERASAALDRAPGAS